MFGVINCRDGEDTLAADVLLRGGTGALLFLPSIDGDPGAEICGDVGLATAVDVDVEEEEESV